MVAMRSSFDCTVSPCQTQTTFRKWYKNFELNYESAVFPPRFGVLFTSNVHTMAATTQILRHVNYYNFLWFYVSNRWMSVCRNFGEPLACPMRYSVLFMWELSGQWSWFVIDFYSNQKTYVSKWVHNKRRRQSQGLYVSVFMSKIHIWDTIYARVLNRVYINTQTD